MWTRMPPGCGFVFNATSVPTKRAMCTVMSKQSMWSPKVFHVMYVVPSVRLGKLCQCTSPESTEFYEFYWNKSRSYLLTAGLDELIEQCLARNPDGLWRCLYCEFSSVHKHHLKNHCEAKHISGGGVECLHCGAISKTRKALAMHMSRKHKNSS